MISHSDDVMSSPSYLLESLIERKTRRLNSYKERPGATEAGVRMMQEDINDLYRILGLVQRLEPTWLMTQIADTIRRNSLLDVDITCLLIPNRPDIPRYEDASLALDDMTEANIKSLLDIYMMHMEGKRSVEVDDMVFGKIDNVLKLYANRGNLYKDTHNDK